jgi:hypothetical protein
MAFFGIRQVFEHWLDLSRGEKGRDGPCLRAFFSLSFFFQKALGICVD